MDKKRSRGVMVAGWGLIILGAYGFIARVITNILFFGSPKSSVKLVTFFSGWFKALKNSGYPLNEIAENVDYMTRMIFNDKPHFVIVTWVVFPVLFFLLFMSGIGILELRNDWRKAAVIVSFFLALTMLVEKIYTISYVIMFVVVGKAITYGKEEVMAEIMKTMKLMPEVLVKDLFMVILPVCLLGFFLTCKSVRKKFKQKGIS